MEVCEGCVRCELVFVKLYRYPSQWNFYDASSEPYKKGVMDRSGSKGLKRICL